MPQDGLARRFDELARRDAARIRLETRDELVPDLGRRQEIGRDPIAFLVPQGPAAAAQACPYGDAGSRSCSSVAAARRRMPSRIRSGWALEKFRRIYRRP